jgi:receptor expression-enhancing protein 5/6
MQKNSSQNKKESSKFDAPPSQHFFEKRSNENNQRQTPYQSNDLDSPNKKSESKNPQNINNNKSNENLGMSKNKNQNLNENKSNKIQNRNLVNQNSFTNQRSIKKEKIKFKTPYFLKEIQKQTNFPAVYVLLLILFSGICIYFGTMEVFLTDLIGIVFPIYWSMRALDTDINSKDEEKQWYTYWLIFLGMLPIDMLFGRFLRHIPLFYFAKFVFLCWLFLPNFYGASYIHDRLIKKNLPQFEIVYRIDNASTQIKKEFKDFTTRLQTKMMESKENEGFKRKNSKAIEKKNKTQNQHVDFEHEKEHTESEENQKTQMIKDSEKTEKARERPMINEKEKQNKEEFLQMKEKEKEQNQSRSNNNNINENINYKNKNRNLEKEKKNENFEEEQTELNTNIENNRNQQEKEQMKQSENDVNKKEKSEEKHESSNSFEGSEVEKSDVSNAYDNLITHINDIKSRSGKTKDLINSTIEKIWGRLHEESLIRKGNQEKDLFENESDKRRYEEQIRKKNDNDSDKFVVDINKGFPVEENLTNKFFEKNDIETKDVNVNKDIKDTSNKVGLDKDVDKDYPNKEENFKIKGERKIKENETSNVNDSENKENIRSENIESKKQIKKGIHEHPNQKDNDKNKEKQSNVNKRDSKQMVTH